MKYNEILTLSEILNEGFFAARVVRLANSEKPLTDSDKKLLCDVLSFIKKAKKGERFVESGKLGSNALDSIGAYRRALNIITVQSLGAGSRKTEKKALNTMLKSIELEVKCSIEEKTVAPSALKQTLTFFESIKRQTSHEASKYYSRKVEVAPWSKFLSY